MNINKVFLAGNLTRDPELRYSQKGTAFCNFSIAVNESWIDQSTGQTQEKTTFVECTMFGRKGEVVAEYFGKGGTIYIEGSLDLNTWTDKETGQNRSKLQVIARDFEFCGRNSSASEGSSRQTPRRAPAQPVASEEEWEEEDEAAGWDEDEDEEIPF